MRPTSDMANLVVFFMAAVAASGKYYAQVSELMVIDNGDRLFLTSGFCCDGGVLNVGQATALKY